MTPLEEVLQYSEELARTTLANQNWATPAFVQLLFKYCRKNRLDADFVAQGLLGLGLSQLEFDGKALKSFELKKAIKDVEDNTNEMLKTVDSQLLIHFGYSLSTVAHPISSSKKFSKDWVNSIHVFKFPEVERFGLWIWSYDSGLIKYLSHDPELVAAWLKYRAELLQVVSVFDEFRKKICGESARDLTKDECHQFASHFNSVLKPSLDELKKPFFNFDDEDDPEGLSDNLAWKILAANIQSLVDANYLTKTPDYNPVGDQSLFHPSNAIKHAMLYLTLAKYVQPDFDCLSVVEKRIVLQESRRLSMVGLRVQGMLNRIRTGKFDLFKHGKNGDKWKSFPKIVDMAMGDEFKSIEDLKAKKPNHAVAICSLCGFVFVDAETQKSPNAQVRMKNTVGKRLDGCCPTEQHVKGWDYVYFDGDETLLTLIFPEHCVYAEFLEHLLLERHAIDDDGNLPDDLVYFDRELYLKFIAFLGTIASSNVQARLLLAEIQRLSVDQNQDDMNPFLKRFVPFVKDYVGRKPLIEITTHLLTGKKELQIIRIIANLPNFRISQIPIQFNQQNQITNLFPGFSIVLDFENMTRELAFFHHRET